MSEAKNPPNVYEQLDKIMQQQAQQAQQLELLAKAVVQLSEKKAEPKEGEGGGDFFKFLSSLIGGDQKTGRVELKTITEAARYWAVLADAVSHYRRPVLPYSGADRFLMRAGARSVYKMAYEGVKKKSETGSQEEPSDVELDKMLGFEGEKGEGEEKRHEF